MMKKLFTLLLTCLVAGTMWATDITFDYSTDTGNGTSTAAEYTITKDGVTVVVSNGMINNHYRIYKGATMTITASKPITGVVFNCTVEGTTKYGPGCFTASTGNYSYSGKVGTWSGSANEVVFTASTNQVRCTSFVVTIDDGGEVTVSQPTFSPKAGTYYAAFDVTLSTTTSGASIYYTTDGSEPTTSSTLYSAPFTISATTTVKAIAALDGKTSAVATAEYVMGTADKVSIAEYIALADSTTAVIKNESYVIGQSGKYLYLSDGTGYLLAYGDVGQSYSQGDVIPAGYYGMKVTYNGEPEMSSPAGFQAKTGTKTITAEEINASGVAHANFGHYVVLKSATIYPNSGTITDASGNTCNFYNKTFSATLPSDSTKKYDIYGIVGSYGRTNTVWQLLTMKVVEEGTDPSSSDDGYSIGEYINLDDNTTATIKNDATVLGQSGRYLYITDGTGYLLVYGDVGQTYNQGDIIPAGFGGVKTTYDGEPEMKTPTGFEASKGTTTVTAEELTPTGVAHANWGHYVVLKSVTINTTDGTLTDASGNTCAYYNNRFNANVPSDLTKKYDAYGIVGSYGKTNTVWQLLTMQFTEEGGGDVAIAEVSTISELYAKDKGVNARFTTDMKAIYQNGKNMYVKVGDEYGLVYGTLTNTFVNGDVIKGAVANWTEYNSIKELIPVDSTFVVDNHGAEVEPETMPVEEVGQDMVHTYLGFYDVQFVEDSTNYYRIIDETGELITFNKFSKDVTIPTLDASKTYDVEGFVTVYKTIIEFYPISVVEHGASTFATGDVNADGEVNIADVNSLISIILGNSTAEDYAGVADVNGDAEINIADVNAVIAIILGNEE